jgi:hypothetical protein
MSKFDDPLEHANQRHAARSISRLQFWGHLEFRTARCPEWRLCLPWQKATCIILIGQMFFQERTMLSSGSDNAPAAAWQQKGSATTSLAPACLLPRLQALHQQFHCCFTPIFCLPGIVNIMADDASRLFKMSDAQLLTHFNAGHPQMKCWRSVHPTSEMLSFVTSALRRKQVEPASLLLVPTPTTKLGSSGPNSARTSASTPGSLTLGIRFCSSKLLGSGVAPDTLHPARDLSSLAQWKEP